MTITQKISELRDLIHERLTPLLSGECVLLDCPYYPNVGDTLIWEGELQFLRDAGQKILGYGSFHTWLFPCLDSRTTVLLSGGGSFGDLWREAQEFRLRVIESYPDNPIVILPQSVHYENTELMRRDAETMGRHRNLTICARDVRTEAILRENFSNKVVLLPDMAFCIAPETLHSPKSERHGTLLIRRGDKEARENGDISAVSAVRDWPTMERRGVVMWLINKLCGACVRGIFSHLTGRLADRMAMNLMRPKNIRAGVRLIEPYETICSTRLHGAILAILMHKNTVMLDNSYGKNSAFYETWLRGTDQIDIWKNSL